MAEENIATLVMAVIFAAIFLFGGKLPQLPWVRHHHRKALSFGAGVSVAYVFIHLLPELEAARKVFTEITEHLSLPFPEYRVYFSVMIGFMFFYGIDYMVAWSRKGGGHKQQTEKNDKGGPVFWFHIGGFALYVWLVTYLRVDSIEEGTVPLALYAFALGFHFLLVEHSLRREHAQSFERSGKYVLAIASPAGWVIGMTAALPKPMVITLLGFISGAIIMNTFIMELPKEKEGRFWPFLIGGILYAALLLPLG
jgi:hypothetical protein